MANGGFAGGFAQGYAQSSASVRQARTLQEQLGLQKQEFEFRKEQSGVQQKQFDVDVNLRTRALDLQQRQQEAVLEHQKYTDKLQQQEIDIKLKLQDSAEIEQITKLLDIGIKGDPKTFANMMKIYQLQKGIDPKDEKAQAIAKLIADLPVQNLEDVKAFIGDMYGKGLEPGTVSVLVKRFMTDPTAFMDFTKSFMSSAASKAQESAPVLVADQNAPYGSRYATREQAGSGAPATGLAGPPRANVLSPEEELKVKGKGYVLESAQKYADDILKSADESLAITPHVETLRAVAKDQDFVTGVMGNARLAIGKWAEFLGINMGEVDKMFPGLAKAIGDPAQGEAVKQAQGFIAEKVAQSMSRLTNIQFSFVQGVVPGLMTTPEGTLIFTDLMDRFADRARRIKQIYNKYELKGDFIGFKQEKDDLDRTDPIINKDMMDRITRVTKGVPGMGIDIKAAAGAAAEAAGKAFVTVQDVGKFPVVTQRTKTMLPVIETARGNMPYVETEADLDLIQPGTIFFYGPKKQLAVKEAPPEPAKSTGPVSPKSVVRIR